MATEPGGPAVFTLEDIEAANDRPIIPVPVPEWGDKVVKVRALSPNQLSSARTKAWNRMKKEHDDAVLSAWCLVEGVLEPKLTFAQATKWMGERAFGPVNAILSEILAATGLGGKAQAEAKSEAAG